jgi:hypothetical protein
MKGMLLQVWHFSSAIELSLHVCINLLTFCTLLSNLHFQPEGLSSVHMRTTLGGVICCSMLHAGCRISSWIGFSLFFQLSFLGLLLLEDCAVSADAISSGLFVSLLALHITTHSWKEDKFYACAVGAFHVRLIRASLAPISSFDEIMIIGAQFLAVLGVRWFTSKDNLLDERSTHTAEFVYTCAIGVLELFLWSSFLSWSWVSTSTLCTLGFAVCVRWCHLGLSPPELLLVFSFLQVAWGSLESSSWSSGNGGDEMIGASTASSHAVLAVSGVGVLGIVIFGNV